MVNRYKNNCYGKQNLARKGFTPGENKKTKLSDKQLKKEIEQKQMEKKNLQKEEEQRQQFGLYTRILEQGLERERERERERELNILKQQWMYSWQSRHQQEMWNYYPQYSFAKSYMMYDFFEYDRQQKYYGHYFDVENTTDSSETEELLKDDEEDNVCYL